MKFLKNRPWPLVILGIVIVFFFWKFFFHGLLPIPADTIVGMYHPWLERVWDGFTSGIPFKNFLITDPVRQQYPWRQLAIGLWRKGQWPLWNPYNQAGTPLLANLQSAVFYPLNLLFFISPFNLAWGVLIFLQPLLAGIFLYLYLRHLKLKELPSLLGALSFSFSGFFIAWLEWNTILHAALWLPLVLLSIEKIFSSQKRIRWAFIFTCSLVFSFLAGHLQTSFYLVLFSLVYLIWRLFQIKKDRLKLIKLFIICYLLFLAITAVQWWPTLRFIQLSARGIDQVDWQKPGWFIPWQHLAQFLAPDFFGNPTTLNYWGEWNYAEFVGYLGVVPLLLAFYTLFHYREKKVFFFGSFFFIALSLALSTPWAKLIYQLKIPFLSTSQPTRLLFIIDFCLAVLAAFGLDFFLKEKGKKIISLLLSFFFLYGFLWLFVLGAKRFWPEVIWLPHLAISKRNLIFPTVILIAFSGLILFFNFFKRKKWVLVFFSLLAFLLTVFDLFRFGWKFTPFTRETWLFPTTEIIDFLKKDKDIFRLMSTDRRLFPPNFGVVYRLQSVDSYDPLYLLRYGELIAASERGEPSISPPFGFNRIITPQNYESRIMDLLNVKYVLSLEEENSTKLTKVFQEGQTRLYENKDAFPRAFMVYDYLVTQDKQEAINSLMNPKINLRKTAVLEELPGVDLIEGQAKVKIKDYQENEVIIEVETDQLGILILTDAYYPGWKAFMNEEEIPIYQADFAFRAVLVPKGEHTISFISSF